MQMRKKPGRDDPQPMVGRILRLHDGVEIRLLRMVCDTHRAGWEAQIYQAVDIREPARKYAVKRYGGAETTQEVRDRALQNARRAYRIGSLLDHPGIAATIDLVDDLFLVTEWIEGITLSRIMRAKKYRSKMAWRWIVALGETLTALTDGLAVKRPGCGHGDVQPTNLILQQGRQMPLKLIDLDYVGRSIRRPGPVSAAGLAWTRQVGRGVLKPPEYALGSEPFLDTCSDCFSYGLIVFWLLRRTPAFGQPDEYQQKVLALARGEETSDAMGYPSGIWEMREDPLGRLLMRMTAFDRNARFASVADALAALKSIVPAG